ncbi:hypothetical protein D3C86_1710940 [compost metagenome]
MVTAEEDADRPLHDRLAGAVIGGFGGLGDRRQVAQQVRVGGGYVGDQDVPQVLHGKAELLQALLEAGVADGAGRKARAAAGGPEIEGDADDGRRERGLGFKTVIAVE